jgi:hypothetical protein
MRQRPGAESRENSPIFVVGSGRSGSTVFFDILARHPGVASLSKFSRDFPGHLWATRLLLRARGPAALDGLLHGRWFAASEAYPFWDRHCPGFSSTCRDLVAADVTPVARERLRAAVEALLTKSRRRFAAKITGWPRLLYLREIYPAATFVHIMRDPCAVASSLLEVSFWDGWRGPPNWRRGVLPPDLDAIWHDEHRSFVALAAIETVIFERAMRHCAQRMPAGAVWTVDYARLCERPVEVFREVGEFCGLPWSPRFEREVKRVPLINRDNKWRSSLSAEQQAVMLRVMHRARETNS